MLNNSAEDRRLRFLRRRTEPPPHRFRRGVYLLPSLFTMGNLFCGYSCVVYATRAEYETAAPFIGLALVLDMLDGRIARMTGTASAFGVEFDALADVISFGLAPAILSLQWGLAPLGRLGWVAGFFYMTAAAIRLARFNIQSGVADKRYFVGLPSPAAAAIPAATVYAYPWGLYDYREALPALFLLLIPAMLMVSTIRFRSFKDLDLQSRRPYRVLLFLALGIMLVAWLHRYVLVMLAYTYLASGCVAFVIGRVKHRGGRRAAEHAPGENRDDTRRSTGA